MKQEQEHYFSGTSGLVLPVPKYRLPEKYQHLSRLAYYATFFNSIEINSTFYKLPQAKTVEKWTTEVPANFKFTFKLWQEITHSEGLNFKEEDVSRFFEVISGAARHKGCILVQFPPSINDAFFQQLKILLTLLSSYNAVQQWRIAVEFRHQSWYQNKTYQLLEQFGAAMVIHDMPESISPMRSTTDFMYVRFHGLDGKYRGTYPDHHLSEYSTFIREWMNEGKTVFSYFNNTIGDAFKNQQTLNRFVLQSV